MRKKRKVRARAASKAGRQADPSADEANAGDDGPAESDASADAVEDEDDEAGADAEDAGDDEDAGDAEADGEGDGELAADPEADLVEVARGADAGEALGEDPDAELSPAFTLEPARLRSILESLLFAADRPLTLVDLRRLTGCNDGAAIQAALDALVEEYRDRGVALYDVAGGYQFRTHPSNSEYVQRLIAGRPVRLSRAQLETLAIIAYRQPVTRPEIDEIRGVDSGSTLKVLLDRTLIRVLGKKEEPGRPLLYGTSREFLEFFNLSELRDLPTLREFHELSEESMREVEALDRAGHEDAPGANGGGGEAAEDGAGVDADDADDSSDDSSSAPLPH
jgi:segregation and condensation protein B